MSYLRIFAPWIAFALIPGGEWQWAALMAFAISAAGIIFQVRSGVPLEAQILELGTAVYFAVLTVLAFADPHTGLHSYIAALSSGALGLIAAVSLALGKPFTSGIAKQTIPSEYWENPLFIRANLIITVAWTASFLIGCAALALAHSSRLTVIVIQVVAFVVPMVFTVRYADHVGAQAVGAQDQAETPIENGSTT